MNSHGCYPNGIRKVVLKDVSGKAPGLMSVKIVGKGGAYPLVAGKDPPFVQVDLELPDVCGIATYPVEGDCRFNSAATKLGCKRR